MPIWQITCCRLASFPLISGTIALSDQLRLGVDPGKLTRHHGQHDPSMYNRCRDLETAQGSVAASEVASSVSWEVLLVEGNSSDQKRSVVEAFCRQHSGRFRLSVLRLNFAMRAVTTFVRTGTGPILASARIPGLPRNLGAAIPDSQIIGTVSNQ